MTTHIDYLYCIFFFFWGGGGTRGITTRLVSTHIICKLLPSQNIQSIEFTFVFFYSFIFVYKDFLVDESTGEHIQVSCRSPKDLRTQPLLEP